MSNFKEMVKVRKGMVEAILLPYLDIEDLIRFGGLSTDCRRFLDPKDKRHINYYLLFNQVDNGISKDAFNECYTWKMVLEVWLDFFG